MTNNKPRTVTEYATLLRQDLHDRLQKGCVTAIAHLNRTFWPSALTYMFDEDIGSKLVQHQLKQNDKLACLFIVSPFEAIPEMKDYSYDDGDDIIDRYVKATQHSQNSGPMFGSLVVEQLQSYPTQFMDWEDVNPHVVERLTPGHQYGYNMSSERLVPLNDAFNAMRGLALKVRSQNHAATVEDFEDALCKYNTALVNRVGYERIPLT